MNQLVNEQEVLIEISSGSQVPFYATEGAAGADIRAFLDEPVELLSGKSILISTGLKMAIPTGYELQIRPRSGLALKHQITVLNSPGTIDSDYRGEIKVLLINHGLTSFIIEPDMRIAQVVLCPVVQAKFIPVVTLDDTSRGSGGFGHTGRT
ncbi:dUTP diphosphatase [Candidatus Clavichlamydia salmonicola]|uniref:dUTP diphosphatase n=1 Tax=Candidatus Clavichlamydia salmonicola TaxID=469812 RepID=UPI0018918D0D|nr:dUTP diphosphatase [Candidatus Clavichlamydia salmonicola]